MAANPENENSSRSRRRKSGKRVLPVLLVILAILALTSMVGLGGYYLYLLTSLPKVDRLADYKPPIVSQVFSDDGTLVGEFYLERRTVVPVDKIPKKLIQAFVSAEDSNFFQHQGLDYLGIFRAALKNLMSMSKKEGASTITQQVARSMLLTPEKKYSRKIKEAILAKRMEEKLSKEEILYIYLNQIYLGGGSSVEIAAEPISARTWKTSIWQRWPCLRSHKGRNFIHPSNISTGRERQEYVLQRMVKEGWSPVPKQSSPQNPDCHLFRQKLNSD
jgi:penicillin-binding protein 1A